ncbi:MAG: endonuclease/exonuclease/phosphatase family protein [Alistipes sp.]|nr:endonuclease/exonuclease/phosphatase family protein [Alistipes sp.]
MKRLFATLAAALVVLSLVGCQSNAELRVATFNIRYDSAADATTGDSWEERKGAVAELILSHDFDIVGTQEGDKRQIADLLKLMPDYDCIGHPYGGGSGDLHTATTFYKRDKLELLDEGTFWYSPTPDEPSLGWDATDLRLCHWGKFRDKASGKEFCFFDSHLYWRLYEAKANSGKVHIAKVQQIAGDVPVVSVGDFNSEEETPQVQDILTLLGDSRKLSLTEPRGCTNTNLGGGNFIGPAYNRIDFIFVSPSVEVLNYAVLEDKRPNGHYPSDHLPIVCNIRF